MPVELPKAFVVGIALASTRTEDRRGLNTLLAGSAWKLIQVPTCGAATATITRLSAPIVLCDLRLQNRPWQDTLRRLLLARSRTCVVLLCDAPDSVVSREVARQGGYDLLVRPFDREQLFQSLFFAYSRYKLGGPIGYLGHPQMEESRKCCA